ncbi:MAG: MFS transporter [Pseudomonadota bacterium]
MSQSPSEVRRNWAIVLACGIGIGAGITGIPFYTLGLFIQPLGAEFEWTRAEVQGMFTVFSITGILAVPVVGWLTDKYSVRRVVLGSLVGTVIGYLCLAYLTRSLITYYISAAVISLLGAGTTPITWTKAISGWFDRQRGLALGLALAGTGFAALTAPNYVAAILDRYDWRTAYLGLALIPLLAIPLVYLLLKEPPGSHSAKADGESAGSALTGVTVAEAIRDWRLWVIFASFFLLSGAIGGSIPNLVPLLMDASMERSQAAGIVGLIGVAVIAGRVVVGYCIDRFWAPGVAAVVQAAPVLSAIILLQPELSIPLVTVAVVLIGFAAGAEFDLIAYLVGRYFGLRHYAKIYTVPYIGFAVSAGLAPTFFGYLFDIQGSYNLVMQICAGLFGSGALLLLTLGSYPKFEPVAD